MTEDSKEIEPRELLQSMVDKFKDKIEERDDLQEELEGFEREITIDFKDNGNYNFSLKETDISEIREGVAEESDITLHTDKDTLNKLLTGDMGPMEAYARKKLKIDASFMDILKIKNLL